MKHDLNVIRQKWREYNEKNAPVKDEKVSKPVFMKDKLVEEEPEGITFDIREDYLEMLYANGYKTDQDVLDAGKQKILSINGIGKATVELIFGEE